jgi:pimeloyl-ACP methyl ester carboxylesterase
MTEDSMSDKKQAADGSRSRRGKPSVAEGMFVDIHGLEQWITIRGQDRNNPPLLIIPGPGAGISRMASFFAPWEDDFTLVQWDQPGAGATYAKHGSVATGALSYERIVRDGTAVVELICRRLGVRKLVVLGLSGGTIGGLMMVKRHPELFCAYVGAGQVVNWARQDALSYEMTLGHALATGDCSAITELEALGPPPYPRTADDATKSKYAGALTTAEKLALASLDPSVMASMKAPPSEANYVPKGLALDDIRAVSMAAYDALRTETVHFDARRLGLEFEVPMFFLQGELDSLTVTAEVQAYASEIRAPQSTVALIPGGGHSAYFMRDTFLALLRQHVRPEAIAGSRCI